GPRHRPLDGRDVPDLPARTPRRLAGGRSRRPQGLCHGVGAGRDADPEGAHRLRGDVPPLPVGGRLVLLAGRRQCGAGFVGRSGRRRPAAARRHPAPARRRPAAAGRGGEEAPGQAALGSPAMRIPVRRLDPTLPLPAAAHAGDAGYDLRAREAVVLAPAGGRAAVATGVAVAIPPGWAGLVLPRSGLALRHGVSCLNAPGRSEEHTSELQSRENLVCRLLLEKKKKNTRIHLTASHTSHTSSLPHANLP